MGAAALLKPIQWTCFERSFKLVGLQRNERETIIDKEGIFLKPWIYPTFISFDLLCSYRFYKLQGFCSPVIAPLRLFTYGCNLKVPGTILKRVLGTNIFGLEIWSTVWINFALHTWETTVLVDKELHRRMRPSVLRVRCDLKDCIRYEISIYKVVGLTHVTVVILHTPQYHCPSQSN